MHFGARRIGLGAALGHCKEMGRGVKVSLSSSDKIPREFSARVLKTIKVYAWLVSHAV